MQYIILIFLAINYINGNLINITINRGIESIFHISSPDYYKKFILDLTLQFTFFDIDDFPFVKNIPSESKRAISIGDQHYSCNLIKNLLLEKSSRIKLTNYTFCVSYYHTLFHPRLALAYKIDKSSSLVHQSFEHRFISQLSFTISKRKGLLFLGGVPKELNAYNKGSCSVIKGNVTWGCILQAIIFFQYEYKVEKYVYFDLIYPMIKTSKKFKDDFNRMMNRNYEFIKKEVLLFPMTFKMGNSLYTIEDLIEKREGKFIAKIFMFKGEVTLYNHFESYDDDFILGKPFFNLFDLNFDYSSNMITIYDNKVSCNISSNNSLLFVLYCNILILCINIVYLILLKFRKLL